MTKSKVNWADVARAYASGTETVDDICAHFSITRSTLYREAKKRRWAKRNVDKNARQYDFLERMFAILNRQLEQLDKRMCADGAIDIATLSNIAKTFEKLVELASATEKHADRKPDGKALKMLRELVAQNIKNLNEQN